MMQSQRSDGSSLSESGPEVLKSRSSLDCVNISLGTELIIILML